MKNWEQWLTAAAPEARVDPRRERAVARRSGSVAIIPVSGVITPRPTILEDYGYTTSTRRIEQSVYAALNDSEVKSIVLAIDSPGGVVSGVPELATNLRNMRGGKPIIAQVDYFAASAAYWIAASTDEIVASPSSMVGSVGAFIMHVDQSEWLEQEGLKVSFIAEPPEKVDGNSFEPLSDTAREELQNIVSGAVDAFRSDVAAGRGIQASQVTNEWARVYTAKAALAMGMIDKIRTFSDTLAAYLGPNGSISEGSGSRQRAQALRQARIGIYPK